MTEWATSASLPRETLGSDSLISATLFVKWPFAWQNETPQSNQGKPQKDTTTSSNCFQLTTLFKGRAVCTESLRIKFSRAAGRAGRIGSWLNWSSETPFTREKLCWNWILICQLDNLHTKVEILDVFQWNTDSVPVICGSEAIWVLHRGWLKAGGSPNSGKTFDFAYQSLWLWALLPHHAWSWFDNSSSCLAVRSVVPMPTSFSYL